VGSLLARGIQGIPRLLRKLEKLKTQTAPAIRPVMEIVAERICQDMRALVPRGETGELAKSIGWTWGKAPERSMVIQKAEVGSMVLTIYAGNKKAFYARWREFGTRANTKGEALTYASGRRRTGGGHSGTRAQPFFYPSFRANKKMFVREMRKALNQAIKAAIR
jgi:HK97 gp10 family phage protein